MSYDRDKAYSHAETYWWRPCTDGLVWIASQPINVAREAASRKLNSYTGVFLWYGASDLEGLFLLPAAKAASARDGKLSSFPEAVMLASYKDRRADEATELKALKLSPPYFGLNDCTHFTTECLAKGGFTVTNDHARRGANDLYQYLLAHGSTKTLASDVTEADASAVISAGLMKKGDVVVYSNDGEKVHHHGVLYVGDGGIAMHTYHQWQRDWQTAGGWNQRYSLFHISEDDDLTSAVATRWIGWWQVTPPAGTPRYYYIGAKGRVHVQAKAPTSTKLAPAGESYWFADALSLKICARLKGDVEEFTFKAAPASGAWTVTGKHINDGSKLTATKLP